MITPRVRKSLRSMVHKLISAELPRHDHSFIACSRHIYECVVLHAHPVRGESHIQWNTTGEVATIPLQSWGFEGVIATHTASPLQV